MITVGIRELKQQASVLVRRVREQSASVQITYHGKVVARLVPVENEQESEAEQRSWAELDELAAEIGRRWPQGVAAGRAVSEGRE
jgi:prevent-host-death family protein